MLAFPLLSLIGVTFDYNAEQLRRMRNWGITNRLQTMNIPPATHIRIDTEALINLISGVNNPNSHGNSLLLEQSNINGNDSNLDCISPQDYTEDPVSMDLITPSVLSNIPSLSPSVTSISTAKSKDKAV